MSFQAVNPRYEFSAARVPAAAAYSVAAAMAALVGYFVYTFFSQNNWLVDWSGKSGPVLLPAIIFAAKLVGFAAIVGLAASFVKRLLDGMISERSAVRTGRWTFVAAIVAAALVGFAWHPWTDFSGIPGATFFTFVILFALSLLGIPFRALSLRIALLAVVATLFFAVLTATRSSAFEGSMVPSLLGLFSTVIPLSLIAWLAPYENQNSKFGSLPMIMIALFVFVGGTLWTVAFSFTTIKVLPLFTPGELVDNFNGIANYKRLFNTTRWMDCPMITKIGTAAWKVKCTGSLPNMVTYAIGAVIAQFALGFLIAVLMDQKIRAEGVFRTIYLYPFALSFIVTGHVWAWILSPEFGLQKAIRQLGWESFSFGWVADKDMVMYAIIIAGVWQGTGLVMALMIAGLRGIDEEIWKAARVDGIPTWRTYLQVVLPMMKPVLVTAFVLVASGAVRIFDLVIALTAGGPGISSDVPSRYIYENFSANLGQSLSASTVLLVSVAFILIPWIRLEFGKDKNAR